MPGYVVHLAVASQVLAQLNIKDASFANDFILGNILPDTMARTQKKASHFWDDDTYTKLNRIPNMVDFLEKYESRIKEPIVLGYYAHILLDNLFVKEYWPTHFDMLGRDGKEENDYDKVAYFRMKRDGMVYQRDEFLSDELYYGDYDRMFPYILENYDIQLPKISQNMSIPIEEIDYQTSKDMLVDMIDRVESVKQLLVKGENMAIEPLKVFEINHIYDLIERVVSNVCELI